MEPVFRLLDFPDELLLHISQYLSVRDILNCCLVCRRLREVLNDDEVWKRHVSPQAVSGLRAREQLVDPPLPSVVDNFCEQRTLCACKTRLVNNWRNGNCVEFITIESQYTYAHGVLNHLKGKGHLVYGERYLFVSRYINDIESDGVEVWDVGSQPVLHTTVLISNVNYDHFFIIGTKLVIVECIKVVVYEITLPEREFPLLYSFIITEESVALGRNVNHRGRCDCGCVGWTHCGVDRYLISNKCTEDGVTVVEIWDVSEGTKLGSFPSPLPGFSTVFFSKVNDKWFFLQNKQSGSDHCLLQFDIHKKQFLDSVFRYTGYVNHNIVNDDTVIQFINADECNENGHYDTVCVVRDFSTGAELTRRRFNNANHNHHLNSTIVFDGKFVVLCTDSFHVVDALSLETIVRFPCNDLFYITHQFKIFGSMFVLVVNRKHDRLELWDVENRRKVFSNWRMHRRSHVFLNSTSSSLVYFDCWYRVCAVHFW